MARFAVSCGGTGGHVFPGVATAHALKQRGHDVVLLLAGRSIEAAARFSWEGPVLNTGAAEIVFKPSRFFPGVLRLARSYFCCLAAFRRQKPAALLAMGSYSSAGPVLAAATVRVPVILHEANVIPGRATAAFAGLAKVIAISFPETAGHLAPHSCAMTGLPLRRELEQAAAGAHESAGAPVLLVMGGSQGAQRLNEMAPQVVAAVHKTGVSLQVIHLAGSRDRDAVQRAYTVARIPAEVHGFCHDMASAYRRATFAISRSGANSCLELAAFGVPALLVPYPHSARDHQTANAQAMAASGAADCLAQDKMSLAKLSEYLMSRLIDANTLDRMRAAATRRACNGAAERLADLVEQVTVPR